MGDCQSVGGTAFTSSTFNAIITKSVRKKKLDVLSKLTGSLEQAKHV